MYHTMGKEDILPHRLKLSAMFCSVYCPYVRLFVRVIGTVLVCQDKSISVYISSLGASRRLYYNNCQTGSKNAASNGSNNLQKLPRALRVTSVLCTRCFDSCIAAFCALSMLIYIGRVSCSHINYYQKQTHHRVSMGDASGKSNSIPSTQYLQQSWSISGKSPWDTPVDGETYPSGYSGTL